MKAAKRDRKWEKEDLKTLPLSNNLILTVALELSNTRIALLFSYDDLLYNSGQLAPMLDACDE
jgi:hypothetical protein